MCSLPGPCRTPPRDGTRVRDALQHAAPDARDAQAGHVIEPVRRALENRLRRTQATADRRADALAEITRGETCRIAGDEGIVTAHDVHAAAQVIAVPSGVVLRPRSERAVELCRQMRPVPADVLAALLHASGNRADADVEPAALFRHVPGVAGQPLLEEPQMAVRVAPVVLDLVLECDDLQLAGARVEFAEQLAVHRAAC